MSFKKHEEPKELELPSFIDMVFLLLIFFMATLNLSSSSEPSPKSGPPLRSITLPEAEGETKVNGDKALKNLLILIEHKDLKDSKSPKIVYILWPDKKHRRTENDAYEILKSEMKKTSPDSSFYATITSNLMNLDKKEFEKSRPCFLIAENIKKFQDEYLKVSRASNAIEVKAVKDTEFRFVNFILEQCGKYKDFIPKVNFHVLSGQGNISGE